ncbi:MAG: hypothetical protein R3E95_09175 [Thiolinea sp.]
MYAQQEQQVTEADAAGGEAFTTCTDLAVFEKQAHRGAEAWMGK